MAAPRPRLTAHHLGIDGSLCDPADVVAAEDYEPVVSLVMLSAQATTPEWMSQAACRGTATGLWFPQRGEKTETAKEICHAGFAIKPFPAPSNPGGVRLKARALN
jgi:hypothetical protein